ncbi:MAG: hypothetical protein IKL94_02905 [Clostridia bacterium]|nr:hypothetical protein [Clostridia bacterium]
MTTTKSTRLAALLLSLILATAFLLTGCSKTSEGIKNITVSIVYADGESENISITTEKKFLADALIEEGIIEYNKTGLYTTINGVTADYNKDKSWWCLTKGGKEVFEGFNTQAISDGDIFEITYTVN